MSTQNEFNTKEIELTQDELETVVGGAAKAGPTGPTNNPGKGPINPGEGGAMDGQNTMDPWVGPKSARNKKEEGLVSGI